MSIKIKPRGLCHLGAETSTSNSDPLAPLEETSTSNSEEIWARSFFLVPAPETAGPNRPGPNRRSRGVR